MVNMFSRYTYDFDIRSHFELGPNPAPPISPCWEANNKLPEYLLLKET